MCDVLVATGEVFHNATDIDVPGYPPFELTRSYSSTRTSAGALGPGWVHNWEVRIILGANSAQLVEGAGTRRIDFGSTTRDEPTLSSLGGTLGIQVLRSDGTVLRFSEPIDGDTWLLTEQTDVHGNRTVLSYSRGRLTTIEDSAGRVVSFRYAESWLAEVTLQHHQSSLTVGYAHDGAGSLTAVLHHSGAREHYTYDDTLLVEHAARSGTVRHLCYDVDRRCVFDWFEDSLRVRKIDVHHPLVTLTDSYGQRDVYELDGDGRIVKLTDPLGHEQRWIYGPEGGVVAHLLADGRPLRTMTWDAQSRTLTGCDLHGAVTTYRFLESGKVSRISNVNGTSLTFVRDSAGNVIGLVGPDDAVWRFEYDRRGALTRVTDPEGRWFSRSEEDGLVQIQDAAGLVATYRFDPLGNLLADTDAVGRTTEYEYQGQDRLIAMRLPHGGLYRWTLDAAGRVLSVADPLERTTRYEYTPFGSVRRTVYPHGREITVHFDREENVIAVQNGRGETTTIGRDTLYRAAQIRFFDGRVDTHAFDERNRVIGLRNGRGEWLRIEYDAAVNPTRFAFADGSVQVNTYDAAENLLAMSFTPGEQSEFSAKECDFTYDGNHHVVAEVNDGRETRYDLDKSGALVGIRDSVGRHLRFSRDVRKAVRRMEENGVTFDFEFSASGEIETIRFPGGIMERFQYDAGARMARREVWSGSHQLLGWRAFSYDTASQLLRTEDWRDGRRTYAYDVGGRLTTVVGPRGNVEEEYAFDVEGNLLSSPDFRSSDIGPGNRFAGAGETRFEYDGAGCVRRWTRRDGTYEFHYGPFDQLAVVTRNGDRFVAFDYDLQGRRTVSRYQDDTIRFHYHLNAMSSFVSERLGTWSFVYVPGTFVPLGQTNGSRWFFYSFDQGGTPTELWRDDGALAAVIRSHAFGSSRVITYATEDRPPIPFHFQGQVVDDRLGLHYNRFRYYCPFNAAFLTHDPIGLAIDANLYVYPRNPLTWIDPFGLASLEITCGLKTRAFDPCEQYAAKMKLESINKASKNRRKKTCTTCRENEQREYFINTCGGNPSSGNQVDHMLELQLGGADYCCDNMMAIPASVNQSFGSQIKNLISGLAEGALVPKFAFAPPGCDQADKCTNKDAVSQKGTKSDGKDCSKEPPLDC